MLEPYDRVNAGFNLGYFHYFWKSPVDSLAKFPAARHVQFTHPSNVTREMSFNEELAHHSLIDDGGVPVADESCCGEFVDQHGRNHQVTEAQRRQQQLAEAARKNYWSFRIESLNRGNRSACVTIFAVVIVLKYP